MDDASAFKTSKLSFDDFIKGIENDIKDEKNFQVTKNIRKDINIQGSTRRARKGKRYIRKDEKGNILEIIEKFEGDLLRIYKPNFGFIDVNGDEINTNNVKILTIDRENKCFNFTFDNGYILFDNGGELLCNEQGDIIGGEKLVIVTFHKEKGNDKIYDKRIYADLNHISDLLDDNVLEKFYDNVLCDKYDWLGHLDKYEAFGLKNINCKVPIKSNDKSVQIDNKFIQTNNVVNKNNFNFLQWQCQCQLQNAKVNAFNSLQFGDFCYKDGQNNSCSVSLQNVAKYFNYCHSCKGDQENIYAKYGNSNNGLVKNNIAYCLNNYIGLCEQNRFGSCNNFQNVLFRYQRFVNNIMNIYKEYHFDNGKNSPKVNNYIDRMAFIFGTNSNALKQYVFDKFKQYKNVDYIVKDILSVCMDHCNLYYPQYRKFSFSQALQILQRQNNMNNCVNNFNINNNNIVGNNFKQQLIKNNVCMNRVGNINNRINYCIVQKNINIMNNNFVNKNNNKNNEQEFKINN